MRVRARPQNFISTRERRRHEYLYHLSLNRYLVKKCERTHSLTSIHPKILLKFINFASFGASSLTERPGRCAPFACNAVSSRQITDNCLTRLLNTGRRPSKKPKTTTEYYDDSLLSTFLMKVYLHFPLLTPKKNKRSSSNPASPARPPQSLPRSQLLPLVPLHFHVVTPLTQC